MAEEEEEGEEEDMKICSECLERRIMCDFDGDLFFRHVISESPLPFGSAAVIEMNLAKGENESTSDQVSAQFLLAVLSDEEEVFSESGHSLDNTSVDSLLRKESISCNDEGGHSPDLKREFTQKANFKNSVKCLISDFSPDTFIGEGSYATLQKLLSSYTSGSAEDHVMSSINLFLERKPCGPHALDFFRSIGLPYFAENNVPNCIRHPNIAPILGLLRASSAGYLLQPEVPYSLRTVLNYSPRVLDSDWHVRFLIFQFLSALNYIHGLGSYHGNLSPSSIMLTEAGWSWLSLCDRGNVTFGSHGEKKKKKKKKKSIPYGGSFCIKRCHFRRIYADLKLSSSIEWEYDFKRWWVGELSNYEYLLILNKLAGRRWGDHKFHMVMPWVIDFTVKPDEYSDVGWRDLRKSKWRLAKGDEQLDFTYSTSEIPHHVSDECLSELAVCSYKARRLPLSILRSAVRSVYEPNEYPSNMQRLYQWTPDECIPEFYSDPRIFYSIHPGMSDLQVPSWAESPEHFISLHRDALESDCVSRQIHHWIDIMFGYKLFGEASVEAKNVMLPTADPMKPKSIGRRQLFDKPHPMRQCSWKSSLYHQKEQKISGSLMENENHGAFGEHCYLKVLEESVSFSGSASHLTPVYNFGGNTIQEGFEPGTSAEREINRINTQSKIDLSCFLESFEADDDGFVEFQDLICLKKQLLRSKVLFEQAAIDMFSVGCIIAELYLKKPLFDAASVSIYLEKEILPDLLWELPAHVKVLVESCIIKDWKRRPSAKSIIESQFFPPTVRLVYNFLAPLQTLSRSSSHRQYAAKLSKAGILKTMGTFSAEMCAPYCLTLISSSLSEDESEASLSLLIEFMRCLKSSAVKSLILPVIQRILQVADYLYLKTSLLQDSFIQKVWSFMGKRIYLEKIHPLVISNLCNSPNRVTASAASVLLIGSCEELGIPISIHQTVLPLIHCFGRGFSADGIDALVRIGGLFGENFISGQILPLLKNVASSCVDGYSMNKSEPSQSWNSLVLIDCFTALDGLTKLLGEDTILRELILDQKCVHIKVLGQTNLDISVLQVVGMVFINICQRIGSESTAVHVLPQLKELFDQLAFRKSSNLSDANLDSHLDLTYLLYPPLASLIGIERLRQSCSTWFLLEQFLERSKKWKWELVEDSFRSETFERVTSPPMMSKDYNPAKLLLTGVGWSVPQSQASKSSKGLMHCKHPDEHKEKDNSSMHWHHQPWFWFSRTNVSLDGADYFYRSGGRKDDQWKVEGSILWSMRAHPGALRSLAVSNDELSVFTAGVGPGFKGLVEKWELPTMKCISGYYGHDETVNDVAILSLSGRVASCDGTVHIWSSLTGKLIASFAEPPMPASHLPFKVIAEPILAAPSNTSSGKYSNAFSGSMYTCLHYLDYDEKLVAGMGSSCIRFIDVGQGRKLHLWKSDTAEHSLSSIVSAICSCGSSELQTKKSPHTPQWLALGSSSGHCWILDSRSGEIITLWQAHNGYVTQLASPEDHILVSSSLDKSLKIWDLRRNLSAQSNIFTGHSDGLSGFATWNQHIISIAKSKIGLSSFSGSPSDISQSQRGIAPLRLYSANRQSRNQSSLTAISILPFSRLFLVGTEDGHLKICC